MKAGKLVRMLTAIVRVRLVEPGHSYSVQVYHDAGCPSLAVESGIDKVRLCACQPDIQVTELLESARGDDNGKV